MAEHPTPTELGVLLEGGLAPQRLKEVLVHLLGCEICRFEVRRSRRTRRELESAHIPPEMDAGYDRVLDSALKTARYLDQELEKARQAAALLEMGGGASALFREGDLPLEGFGVYQTLIKRCRTVRYDNPQEMVSLARCAVEAAPRLCSEAISPKHKADLLAQAWGELGNAYRVADNLIESARAFSEAFRIAEKEGSGQLNLKARLYDLLSSLHGTQREFTLAFAALDVAFQIYEEIGDSHAAGRIWIKKAMYKHYSGESDEAIAINNRGLALVDLQREPDLLGIALHNHLWFLVACGRFQDARRVLFDKRPHCQEIGRVHALKLRWLEGQISYGMNQLKSAEETFLEVRQGFEKLELGYAAALSSLDLGLVWMRQNRTREAKEIVIEAAELFTSLKVRLQALVAVLLLRDAFATDTASLALFESVVEFIRRSDIDPDARFVPPTE